MVYSKLKYSFVETFKSDDLIEHLTEGTDYTITEDGTGKHLIINDYVSIPYQAFKNETFTKVTLGKNVSIGIRAFENNQNLTELTISKGVKISTYAFSNTNLTELTIPDGVALNSMAFNNTPIAKITIKGGDRPLAFNYDSFGKGIDISNLERQSHDTTYVKNKDGEWIIGYTIIEDGTGKHLEIHDSVKTIPSDHFRNQGLTSVIIGNNVETIGEGAFKSNKIEYLTIPEGVEIGNYAFKHNLIKELKISKDVKIGQQAFDSNKNLTKVTLSPNIMIGVGAFIYNQIKELTIPEGVKLEWLAFASVPSKEDTKVIFSGSITKITIKGGKEEVLPFHAESFGTYVNITNLTRETYDTTYVKNKDNVFVLEDNKTDLFEDKYYTITEDGTGKHLTIHDSVKPIAIGNNAFESNEIKKLTIPEGVAIGDYAFSSNSIKELTIPEDVKIGNYAFKSNKIEELTLSPNIMIGDYAFSDNNIKKLIIPEGVRIGYKVFNNNKNLTKITLSPNVIIFQQAFSGIKLTEITIPEGVELKNLAFDNTPITKITIKGGKEELLFKSDSFGTNVNITNLTRETYDTTYVKNKDNVFVLETNKTDLFVGLLIGTLFDI